MILVESNLFNSGSVLRYANETLLTFYSADRALDSSVLDAQCMILTHSQQAFRSLLSVRSCRS
jgi:hypothetical protein